MTHVTVSPLSVAIVGAGPAGIHAAGALNELAPGTRIDLFEQLPAPYGLVRYGVAPDHPEDRERLAGALREVLAGSGARLFCDARIGVDLSVDELRDRYDAVILATGARRDVPFELPGIDLPGSFGAADFVAWYNGHPDVSPEWPLGAESAAVIGAGNVALDVTRMLIAVTPVRDVHLFARRGPADTRFSPAVLAELGAQEDVDVIVDPADLVPDPHSDRMTRQFAPVRRTVEILREWSRVTPRRASRRVRLHFHHIPVALLGSTGVERLRTERAAPDGYGRFTGSGEYQEHAVQAVYRAIGYAATPLAGVPFDTSAHTVPHRAGAVVGAPGLYTAGWLKRGCVGLVGAAKADARQTVETLLRDLLSPVRPDAAARRR